jgi:hypothetical protein
VKDTHLHDINFTIANIVRYRKKKLEPVSDFGKKDLELTFVEVDDQLAELATSYDTISKVRRLITIQQIRSRLFELCNLCVHGLDIRAYASHKPGDKTPLNSEDC